MQHQKRRNEQASKNQSKGMAGNRFRTCPLDEVGGFVHNGDIESPSGSLFGIAAMNISNDLRRDTGRPEKRGHIVLHV